jgi:hypothetical protein
MFGAEEALFSLRGRKQQLLEDEKERRPDKLLPPLSSAGGGGEWKNVLNMKRTRK